MRCDCRRIGIIALERDAEEGGEVGEGEVEEAEGVEELGLRVEGDSCWIREYA